jgi:hypothetical protein
MKYTFILAALALAACAPRPGAIAPASVPGSLYDGMTCHAARAEAEAIAQRLASLEAAQNSAATGDAVGVFLIGVPVSSLTGGDRTGQIAIEKGKTLAMQARLTRC